MVDEELLSLMNQSKKKSEDDTVTQACHFTNFLQLEEKCLYILHCRYITKFIHWLECCAFSIYQGLNDLKSFVQIFFLSTQFSNFLVTWWPINIVREKGRLCASVRDAVAASNKGFHVSIDCPAANLGISTEIDAILELEGILRKLMSVMKRCSNCRIELPTNI